MKLDYFTPLTFPSRYVNRLQVMKMAAAFTKRADFSLYIAESRFSHEILFREYNIRSPFFIQEVGSGFFVPPRRIWQACKFLTPISNAPTETVWYVRDVLLADWLLFFSKRFRNRYFFELHTLARFSDDRYRRVLTHARGVITTNEEKKEDIIKKFPIAANRILVASNGVDLEEFQILKDCKTEMRKELGFAENLCHVVYAGTDAEPYGTLVLREAAQFLKNMAQVHIISGRSRNEALKYMAAADVLVAPYIPTDEHFRKYMSPMKLREYMAMERPIIVSDLPSTRAYLPQDAAFFVPAGSVQQLVLSIRSICSDAGMEERKQRVRRAATYVGQFSWDLRAERILHFIMSLL